MILRDDALGKHETKYVFENKHAVSIIQWLKSRCLPDADFPAGEVCNIYFDTRNWQYMQEKFNSDFFKTKVRLRWYKDIGTGEPFPDSFLEMKHKIGNRRQKVRLKSGKTGQWLEDINLENPQLLELLQLFPSNGISLKEMCYPVFKLSYKRLRFTEPITGARLSVDYDIHSPAVNWQMVPKTNPFKLHTAVFEMKGDHQQLPGTLHQLAALGCRKEAFSKYEACYNKIMNITC